MPTLANIQVVHPGAPLQCTSYLIEAPGGVILVDPGSGIVEAELLANLAGFGHEREEIRAVLLTHCHVDHARGAYRFRRPGTPLVASPRTAEILRVGGHQVWYEYPDYVHHREPTE